jgi:signal transduction histidine kinase/ActR/RegA family two-component response regulator
MSTPESAETRRRIASECRQLVLAQGRAGALATLGVASLFWFAVRDVHPEMHLALWAVAVGAVCVLRVALAVWSRRIQRQRPHDLPDTSLLCLFVGAASGAVWGTAATLLFPLGHSDLYFITAFLLIGMPAGAISSFGAWWPAYAAYVIASVGPFAVFFFFRGQTEFVLAGLAACLFGGFLLREGFVIEQTIRRNIAQRDALMTMTRTLGEALDRADAANRAKSSFLANMSHELRTPLNAIIGMSRLLADAPDAPAHRQLPGSIHRAGQALHALISDVLDLSQIEAGRIELHPAPFAPQRMIADVIDMFAPEAEARSLILDAICATELPERFVADQARLRQVVINLVANAIKFTAVGSVRIETACDVDTDGVRMLRIQVVDTGIGIAERDRERIFLAFQQADDSARRLHSGTGLGLKISTELVGLMGGRIELSSVPGAGSRFTVIVPETRDAQTGMPAAALVDVAADETPPAPRHALAGLRVLVIEDNTLNATLVRLMLERDGCIVECAANGAHALELLHARSWDIALMDCQMPDMDGYAVTRRWRQIEVAERRRRLPIVALTAHALAEDRRRCLDAGMDDYLSKPLRHEVLCASLARLCAAAEAESSPP